MSALRSALVVLLAALPLLSWWIERARAAVERSFDIAELPRALDQHVVVGESEFSADVLKMITPEAYALRLYERADGWQAWTYVAFYDGIGATGAHDPRVCYPSQGWDIVTLRPLDVALEGGGHVSAQLMTASLGSARERVLYWFQPARRWSARQPREQLLRAFDALAGRPQNAFVRLSTRLRTPGEAAEREAEEGLERLAREIAPYVRRLVDETTGAASSDERSS